MFVNDDCMIFDFDKKLRRQPYVIFYHNENKKVKAMMVHAYKSNYYMHQMKLCVTFKEKYGWYHQFDFVSCKSTYKTIILCSAVNNFLH